MKWNTSRLRKPRQLGNVMAKNRHIDKILQDWPYRPTAVNVRFAQGSDGREVIQMRIEMGILQMEVEGRPDGDRPAGCETFLHYLEERVTDEPDLVMTEEECSEADREFVQFYHRRICWLAVREFERAVRDATHSLTLMDFCRDHSPDEAWTMSHEQYRPFVMFHRIQAAALQALEEMDAETAVEEINQGLEELEDFFVEYNAQDEFEENELVARLVELRESVREKFEVGQTLQEKLVEAIAAEQYELAAQLRDELASRRDH